MIGRPAALAVAIQAPATSVNEASPAARDTAARGVRPRRRRHHPTARTHAAAGTSPQPVAFSHTPRPTRVPNATALAGVSPRLRMRTPSQRTIVQIANVPESGFTPALMKVTMGWSPASPAVASWSSRLRPKISPASSHAPVVVTSSRSTDQIRMA